MTKQGWSVETGAFIPLIAPAVRFEPPEWRQLREVSVGQGQGGAHGAEPRGSVEVR